MKRLGLNPPQRSSAPLRAVASVAWAIARDVRLAIVGTRMQPTGNQSTGTDWRLGCPCRTRTDL